MIIFLINLHICYNRPPNVHPCLYVYVRECKHVHKKRFIEAALLLKNVTFGSYASEGLTEDIFQGQVK